MDLHRPIHRTRGRTAPPWFRLLFVAFVALLFTAAVGRTLEAQENPRASSGSAADAALTDDDALIPLMTPVLGPLSRPISTQSAEAQAYFDQGLQLFYAFTMTAAVRSFEEAQRRDPECAMCFWGEALARGPFLNGGLTGSNAGPAYEAAREASRLADSQTLEPVEHALIEAMSLRYAEEHDAAIRARLDSGYVAAMEEVHRAHPADLDVGTLYGESLMLLDPNRREYRIGSPAVQAIHAVLEEVLARDVTHPGACHLYIHATEATEEPERAEACAAHLGDQIPGASHINHMPSHTYANIGRWGDAVRGNTRAWHSDLRAATNEGVSYAANHNLHMLLFAASMDGQGSLASIASREYADQLQAGEYQHALVLLRFGWFDGVLALNGRPEGGAERGLWDFARGYAHLRSGNADSASVYLAQVEEMKEAITGETVLRFHPGESILGIGAGILEGEMLRAEGRLDEAIVSFERASELHLALPYDEPEPLPFSAGHWLGAALLEAERPAEAQAVYETALEQHPENGWSLFGLAEALEAQGRPEEAGRVRARFEEAWARSDTPIRASRF